jgi:F-type H+-transporting ATPase subunit epsilon
VIVRIVVPSRLLAEWSEVSQVQARGEEGSMGILPRRLDFTSPLVPGIVEARMADGGRGYAAVDRGVLLKEGEDVTVVTRRAVLGEDLGALRETVRKEFEALDDREREARVALARLEARMVRRFVEERRRRRT